MGLIDHRHIEDCQDHTIETELSIDFSLKTYSLLPKEIQVEEKDSEFIVDAATLFLTTVLACTVHTFPYKG